MIPHIPQELIEAILEEVHESSLNTCALTARSFVDPSQRRIFRRIDFYASKPSVIRHFEFLYILLSNSPRLASYVRSVIICLHPILFHGMTRLLAACTRLEFLALGFTMASRLDSSSLPIAFIDGLLRQVASGSLDRLELWGGGPIPISLFRFVVGSVRTLALWRIHIDHQAASNDGLPIDRCRTSSVRLEHLTVGGLDRTMWRANSTDQPKEIRNFEVLQGLQKITAVQWTYQFVALVKATSSTLREFRVDLTSVLREHDVMFPTFEALRILEVQVPVDGPIGDHWSTQAAPTVQRLLRSTPLLEQMTIVFKAHIGCHIDPNTPPSPWTIFNPDELNLHLGHLRIVRCCLSSSPSLRLQEQQAVAWDNFPPWIEIQMPGLHGTGLLTCSQVLPEKYAVWDKT
ncbi:hypothetical protein B0H19DRAFT_1275643 [Mycena capillaripes]|nr:hypothetical protein B0H19DRAFT_1275643 [Mycena capillaripes]